MSEKRRFERKAIINAGDEKTKIQVIVEGKSVHLMNFSVGGLYILSEKLFSKDELVKLSIEMENTGGINVIGKVVRSKPEPDNKRWGIAIDLLHAYNQKSIHKL